MLHQLLKTSFQRQNREEAVDSFSRFMKQTIWKSGPLYTAGIRCCVALSVIEVLPLIRHVCTTQFSVSVL